MTSSTSFKNEINFISYQKILLYLTTSLSRGKLIFSQTQRKEGRSTQDYLLWNHLRILKDHSSDMVKIIKCNLPTAFVVIESFKTYRRNKHEPEYSGYHDWPQFDNSQDWACAEQGLSVRWKWDTSPSFAWESIWHQCATVPSKSQRFLRGNTLLGDKIMGGRVILSLLYNKNKTVKLNFSRA